MKKRALSLLLAAALAACSATPAVDLAEIQTAIAENRFQEARAGLLSLRDAEGPSRETAMLLTQVLVELGDGYAAERYLTEWSDPANPDWATLTAHAMILQGRAGPAQEFLDRYQGPAPANDSFDWLRVWIAMELDDIETAETLVDEALSRYPQSALLHAKAARLSIWRGNWDAARRHADAALASDPANYEALLVLGESQIADGNLEGALATYGTASRTYPDFAVSRANEAGLLLDLGRLDEAQTAIDTGINAHPDFALLRFSAARLQAIRGNWTKAREVMQALPSEWKRSFPASILLEAEIEAGLGNIGIARTYAEQLADDPRFGPQAQALLADWADQE